ncbi:MAG: S9 family peptidase [Acidobacteria bacterium]|nr:S9 family peptidase [Acidobacteriota bacterium]
MKALLLLSVVSVLGAQTTRLVSSDLYRLRNVGDVRLSPDGGKIAYTVSYTEKGGKPYSKIEILDVASKKRVMLGGETSGNPVWSPDGTKIACSLTAEGRSGLHVVNADGSGARFLSKMEGTNSPLPLTGPSITWSPDSKRVAFVDARPGPETADASGDPVVITRYLYKPDHDEGNTRFNDNRRLHIFLADVGTGEIKQITDGVFYEHSIDWSPGGQEILFVSNREPDADIFHNYDIWAVRVADGVIRRITSTEHAEYMPRWSPDGKRIAYIGTRRGLTDLETTMEDTHVWTVNADGTGRREIGRVVDNRQGGPLWAPEGTHVYFTALDRGNVRLVRLPAGGGVPETLVKERGTVGGFSVARGGRYAYAFTGVKDTAQLFLKDGSAAAVQQLTALNAEVLQGKELAEVEAFTFQSNDFKFDVEAYLTLPLGKTADSKHPLIVMIHGGPHAQQGPAFNFKAQVYAARGWATLMVNYRGSTGYGQKFADAVFGDQNGNEGQDVLYAVSAAARRNPWIDRERMGVEGGSYGGQLSAWLVTQTHIFKAAIPLAPIINLVSYNYMTYYNMYEQMTFGVLPHQGDLMDTLWKRSSLRYVAQVKTPVMLLHGENDNDVCIAESEQFYIGLKDVGVDAVMVRYPREGHGLKETKHIIDSIDRSIRWYEKYFPR